MKIATITIHEPGTTSCGQYIATITFTHKDRTWSTPAAPGFTEERAIANARRVIALSRATEVK